MHNWDASNPIQLTGESETNAQQRTDDQLTANSYGWDFYKLLLVPSASRLFFARVAGDGLSAGDRCRELSKTLIGLVEWYGPALLREHDELGAVIIPASKSDVASSQILLLGRGRLRPTTISAATITALTPPRKPRARSK